MNLSEIIIFIAIVLPLIGLMAYFTYDIISDYYRPKVI